jgi:sugar phosphate isomerase/epimerase
MKIGIMSGAYVNRYGLDAGFEKMREHGYEAIDDQSFAHTEGTLFRITEREFEATLTERRRKYEQYGITVSQIHGPWRYPIRDFTAADRAERFEKMAKSIRGCALLGCPYMVIHNVMPYGPRDLSREVVWEINAEFMGRLIEVGREHGVVVCMENMPFIHQHLATPKALLEFVRTFDSPWLRLCLDTGHAAVFKNGTTPADAVRLWGTEYLRTMHVHDNDGRRDCHWMPGKGVIDWADFAAALQEIGYKGVLSLETAVPADVTEDRDAAERALAKTALTLAGR